MNKVAIIILNWNGKEDTLECLKSIRELSIYNLQLSIIVVDNGSTDGSVDALKNLKTEKQKNFHFHLIENKKNLGFCEGNNVGIKTALKDNADYIMLLNNDTIVDEDLVVQLIATAKYKGIGILSPKIYFVPGFEFHKDRYTKQQRGKIIWYAGGVINWDNVLASHRGVDEVDKGQYSKVLETDFATGACMFIKREVFGKIGFLDPRYFLYLEDVDFCERARRVGFRVLYAPPAHLWHKVAQSSAIGSALNDYYITRNRLIFGMQYAPLRARLALIREGMKLLLSGRPWQQRGVFDFYFGKFGKGSFKI